MAELTLIEPSDYENYRIQFGVGLNAKKIAGKKIVLVNAHNVGVIKRVLDRPMHRPY